LVLFHTIWYTSNFINNTYTIDYNCYYIHQYIVFNLSVERISRFASIFTLVSQNFETCLHLVIYTGIIYCIINKIIFHQLFDIPILILIVLNLSIIKFLELVHIWVQLQQISVGFWYIFTVVNQLQQLILPIKYNLNNNLKLVNYHQKQLEIIIYSIVGIVFQVWHFIFVLTPQLFKLEYLFQFFLFSLSVFVFLGPNSFLSLLFLCILLFFFYIFFVFLSTTCISHFHLIFSVWTSVIDISLVHQQHLTIIISIGYYTSLATYIC